MAEDYLAYEVVENDFVTETFLDNRHMMDFDDVEAGEIQNCPVDGLSHDHGVVR